MIRVPEHDYMIWGEHGFEGAFHADTVIKYAVGDRIYKFVWERMWQLYDENRKRPPTSVAAALKLVLRDVAEGVKSCQEKNPQEYALGLSPIPDDAADDIQASLDWLLEYAEALPDLYERAMKERK